MIYLKVPYRHLSGRTEKKNKNNSFLLAAVPAEIQKGPVPNRSPKSCSFKNIVGLQVFQERCYRATLLYYTKHYSINRKIYLPDRKILNETFFAVARLDFAERMSDISALCTLQNKLQCTENYKTSEVLSFCNGTNFHPCEARRTKVGTRGMIIVNGKPNCSQNNFPVTHHPPQTPPGLASKLFRAPAVRIQQITPELWHNIICNVQKYILH